MDAPNLHRRTETQTIVLAALRFSTIMKARPRDYFLFAEAVVALAVAAVAVKRLPFRRLVERNAPMRAPSHRHSGRVQAGEAGARIAWAVEAAARRVPWRTVCLQKGVAARAMLQRRRLPAVMHYGIRQGEGRLKAHVWVTSCGRPVVGNDVAAEYACVAVFPAQDLD